MCIYIYIYGMGLLWARDFEDLWEVHGSRCSFFVPSCPRMLVANDIAARSHLYDIYIYMHTSKISSSWVTRNKTYCTCTARNYITLSTVLCHLASEYQREKINFALLRHAQMIGFCLLLGFYSKHEQEETVLLIDRRFHFVPKQYCIFQSSLHKEIWCFASPLRKCKARPWDVHSIPLEQVRSVFHIF